MQINKRKLLRLLFKIVVITISVLILALATLFLSVYWGGFGKLPGKEELTGIQNEQASLVLSSNGTLIGKFFAENRTNIKHDEVPQHLIDALIATEDKRFFSHKGYDALSYLRVFFRSILMGDKSGGGGSTLTQQLIKNLYGRENHGFLTMPVNKIKEAIIATRMEEVYNKDELLLLYLNSVPFGEDVYGVESASRRYFNKRAKLLHIHESAVLVGMLKGNTYFNPRLNPENSLKRRNLVLSLMVQANYLNSSQKDSLQKLPLGLNYENLKLSAPAGYFVHQVKKRVQLLLDSIQKVTGKEYDIEKDGLKIYTTLSNQLQDVSLQARKLHLEKMQVLLDNELTNFGFKKKWFNENNKDFDEHDLKIRKIELLDWDGFSTHEINKLDSLWHYYKMLNASVIIINPKNGKVLTWIGGNNYRILPFDMVMSHRQIASAFKPILYATAIDNGISPCEYLKNEEKEYPEYKNWKPQNANLKSTPDSTVAMWYALAQSMNIPSVELLFKTGIEKLLEKIDLLNFPLNGNENPSLALGTLDLSLYEIAQAYGAFANNGKIHDLVLINRINDSDGTIIYEHKEKEAKEIFSKETSEQVTAVLQQVIEQGTGQRIRTQYKLEADLAGKTGSAQNYSNAWFIAYNPEILVATWVGASTPDIHFYTGKGSGSSLALPIVAEIFNEIEKNESLNSRYISSFKLSDEFYSFLDCSPYRRKGIKGFFSRLFTGKDKKRNEEDSIKKEKKKKKRKPFLKRIFKK